MKVTISGRHTSITDAMKQYATEKIDRLERYNDMVTHAEVVMDIEGERHKVEMIAHTKVGGRLIGKAEHTDMYAAIDLLMDKMERQLKTQKEKVKVERKHSGRVKPSAVTEASPRRGPGREGEPEIFEGELES